MNSAILLTLKLAFITSIILMVICLPLAFYLSQNKTKIKIILESLFTLPMVLPPTVLGFYLLIFLGPESHLGQLAEAMGLGQITFSFTGLVIGSVFYSLPFVLQPLQNAFEALGRTPWELAQTLSLTPIQSFFKVMLPLIRTSVITSFIMGFAHTVGEFGVVLMIGGNIPGSTKVLSVELYELVENLKYSKAHQIALMLLAFSFLCLLFISLLKRNMGKHD